ncbi:hypothetical protein E4T56_gene19220 [Termitomyces sp. T112]|nr:hypothetical protein E4T56_gene19220 [Termitomyces sp. T112]KAH0584370.1 hypothetical protein H2248_009910 [Termitomyces sp. 'cryptogamus']KNZ75496.1 hypothetical protein J132_02829 [Termitomyces sp. J132]
MSSDHSVYSYDKEKLLPDVPCHGKHKVKYQPHEEWDFLLDTPNQPIDLSLVLPHYRARNQPIDHRMGMFIGSNSAPIKVKVCRQYPRTRFYLEIQAGTSDVTVWLPSDFRGQIHHVGKARFSAGFINRILQNSRVNEPECDEECDEDDVVVCTHGRITFRMWDIQTSAPENTHKETLKRMFGCTRKAPETAIDWDFLLED